MYGDRPEQDEEDIIKFEMPCQCDCGYWFDLLDGYGTNIPAGSYGNKVVCEYCYEELDEEEKEW